MTADIANATTYEDIAGQWCGDVTDHVFAPNTLTVKFHDGRPVNVFKITKYTYTNDSVRIDWLNDGKESVTVFAEFGGTRWRSRRTAANRADLSIAAETSSYLGKVGPNLRGRLRRCKNEHSLFPFVVAYLFLEVWPARQARNAVAVC